MKILGKRGKMNTNWLTKDKAAKLLSCSASTIQALADDGLLAVKKKQGNWLVSAAEITTLKEALDRTGNPETTLSAHHRIDPGLVQVALALASIAAAVVALLPNVPNTMFGVKGGVAYLASVMALFSGYSAIWLLARYCTNEESSLGFKEIWSLLIHPGRNPPYWFLALAMISWQILAIFIGIAGMLGGTNG
jgi:hypothetical protein